MADGLTATIEDAALIRALDRLPAAILARCRPVAKDTAERIAAEQRRRVARRTGHTAKMIRVEEDHVRAGYVVVANDPGTRTHLEDWLEHGTQHMTARPFFDAPARLEAGGHDRRMREAIQDAMDADGLGT